MKCTYNNCGKETGKPCPPQWIKHITFDPRALFVFFQPCVEGKLIDEKYRVTLEDLEALDEMVCDEHLPIWKKFRTDSLRAIEQAKGRRKRVSMKNAKEGWDG